MISNGDFYSDLLMEGTNYFDVRFIAGIDNLAKVWVAHSEYTIIYNFQKPNCRGTEHNMGLQI
jgi:hypothetical protein